MKKCFIILSMLLLAGMGSVLKAQDCEKITNAFLMSRGLDRDSYPEDKLEYWCQFSQNSFYITNDVPRGAKVFDLKDLTGIDGTHPQMGVAIDLNTLSYWAYNFLDFQAKDYMRTIYFYTGVRTARYLAVRSHDETMDRTNNPDKYEK